MAASAELQRLVNTVVAPGVSDAAPPPWLAADGVDGPSAVVLFAGGDAVRLKADRPDLIVLSDEEGGTVSRLEPGGGSSWPSAAALGSIDDVDITRRVGAGIAAMSRDAGIDVVLAPVADVNSCSANPVIGVRSYGDDPSLVARHAIAFARGVESQGVAACAKHFPGHGATTSDSHRELPVIDADLAVLRGRDLLPFAGVIDAGVRCVLTAHVSVPRFDALPATMSSRWIDILRDELGFDGVVISDALDMSAIADGIGRAAGAVAALRAGVDLLCIGNPSYPQRYDSGGVVREVRAAIAAAVTDGELSLARLEAAARRIADLRTWLVTQRGEVPGPADTTSFGREVARRAVQVEGDVRLNGPPLIVIADDGDDIAAGARRSAVAAAIVERQPAAELVKGDELVGLDTQRPVVVITARGSTSPVVDTIREASVGAAIVVHTGARAAAAPIAAPLIVAMSDTAPAAAAVVDLLFGGT